MKKVYSLIVLTAVLALSSCSFFEDDKSSKGKDEIRTIVELPDSVKQKIAEQDTLMTELLNKVDTLTAELNLTKEETAELKEKIDELKSPKNTWAYISIGAFVLCLIALIISLLKPKGINEKQVYEFVEKSLDEPPMINKLQKQVNNLLSSQRNNKMSNTSSSCAPNSDSRLRQLENQMAQVIEVINKKTIHASQPVSTRKEPVPSRKENEYQKVGYAKVDTDIYFTTIYESNQEGCVFKLTFTCQSKGKFNIIALDKIQSRNDWQKKVECSGVSIKEATDFRLEDEGVCEKIDENTWKVTKPLKIRLIK